MTEATPARQTRSYDSSRRQAMAADNRLAVLGAASRLFGERGWSGTGMRDIARAAGVSVETVYGVGTKSQLLVQAIDVGVVGDGEPVPLADRDVFRDLGRGDRATRLLATTRMLATQYARVAQLHRALESGAMGDEDLAEKLDEVRERQSTSFGEALSLILGRPAPELVNGLQAIGSPEVYLQLVGSAGWSATQYEEWLAHTWGRLLDHIPEEKS